VWSVIGGIAQATERLRLGTGVTCPLLRIHPAIIAQAAATCADMMPGRFFLGLGAGENLNEHILGDKWPEGAIRLEMLEEAIEIIHQLWSGEYVSHYGTYYTVEEARLYTLPLELPPLCIAVDGRNVAQLAGEIADGLVGVTPDRELIHAFATAGGEDKPRYGQMTVCWAEDEKAARRTAHEMWPTSGLQGNLSWEIKTPKQFQHAVKNVSEEDVAKSIICGPDPKPYLEKLQKFGDAGYDHVYFHQVGPNQEGFLEFFERKLAPALRG
jgi:G6PDH family F420-dependent oxidoreductase